MLVHGEVVGRYVVDLHGHRVIAGPGVGRPWHCVSMRSIAYLLNYAYEAGYRAAAVDLGTLKVTPAVVAEDERLRHVGEFFD